MISSLSHMMDQNNVTLFSVTAIIVTTTTTLTQWIMLGGWVALMDYIIRLIINELGLAVFVHNERKDEWKMSRGRPFKRINHVSLHFLPIHLFILRLKGCEPSSFCLISNLICSQDLEGGGGNREMTPLREETKQ